MTNRGEFHLGASGIILVFMLWFGMLSAFTADGLGEWLLLMAIALLSLLGSGLTIYVVAMSYYSRH